MASLKPASSKQESLKHAHGEVQSLFAKMVAGVLDNPHGKELQCCITYSKPCGCIRKYVLGGEKWKDNQSLQLRNSDDIDPVRVAASDKQMLGRPQIERARELVAVYEHAAELKKEKCYAFNNVEVEGKSLKELRGMIGLGNGRKRSKKYEDYVLQMRSKLRTEYTLCEKAAQKLLGYSINFLYKKLRTNPQKTSRLVATNKAERASKAPRHLIPLEELKEMGRKSNGTNQCCGRNCISRLASQHFDKIENWRRRLEGSGQRVAQEIVAEVLRASASSLDGQSSFCQNLVHWVTGCSFKKIRRVRDHLKKDPQSLPEHGLKKYWKDKVKNKQKSGLTQKIPKMEKHDVTDPEMLPMESSMYYYGNSLGLQIQQSGFGVSYSNITEGMYASVAGGALGQLSSESSEPNSSAQWQRSNANNSNNMIMPQRAYGIAQGESKPIVGTMPTELPAYSHQLLAEKNRGTPDAHGSNKSGHYQNHGPVVHGQSSSVPYPSQDGISQFRMQQQPTTASPYQALSEAASNPQYNEQYMNVHATKKQGNESVNAMQQNLGQVSRGSVILHTAASHHQQHAASQKELPSYNQPEAGMVRQLDGRQDPYCTGLDDANQNEMLGMTFNPQQMYGQHYYIAAANNRQDSSNFFHGSMHQGLTPFVLSSGDAETTEDNRTGDVYRQPFYILSPLAGTGEKGFSANNLKNIQQLPLTPIQILPTPYLQSGTNFDYYADSNNRQEQQQFLFPMPFTSPETLQSSNFEKEANGQDVKAGDQNPAMHFPGGAALTSLAVVHNGSGLFNLGPWQAPNQSENAGTDMQLQSGANGESGGQQWPILTVQQYPPNVNLDQIHGQTHNLYNTARSQSSQVHYELGMLQPQRPNWGEEDGKKPVSVTMLQNTPHSSETSVSSQHQETLTYDNAQRELNKREPLVYEQKDTQDEDTQGGIVTPKIIRDALCNNYGARGDCPVSTEGQSVTAVPPLAPIGKKTENPENTPTPPALEMPKLAPIRSKLKQTEEGINSVEGDNEERCAPINSRVKRFSRDRLRATIDSPNIVLTPFTPLTPSITPVIVVPDTSEDDTLKETSASSTNSQQNDGSIFLFPPTHVSRRRAAIRLQGQTVSKIKSPKGSPNTPGPFPVADEENIANESTKSELMKKDDNADEELASGEKTKSPALTLRGLTQTAEGGKIPKEKIPVIGFDASNWQSEPGPSSPNVDASDDNALNTPTQQPLNTPTSLNTPTQQLNTPNQDLRTPTESPVKSLHPAPSKRKRDASPSSNDPVTLVDDSVSAESKSSATAAKSLRFHCFTPKDFHENASCSAFRKPSEFASAPTDSAIAQRRRRPRKQPHPSSVTSPEDENPSVVVMTEVNSHKDKESDNSLTENESENIPPVDSSSEARETKTQISTKPVIAGFTRAPEGNVMILNNSCDSQTPSFLQLVTPSIFPSTVGVQDTVGQQKTPFSSQQVNTPVFLHSATFLTPGGSSVLRKISPGVVQAGSSGNYGSPQVFTFMPSALSTPKPIKKMAAAPEDETNTCDTKTEKPQSKEEGVSEETSETRSVSGNGPKTMDTMDKQSLAKRTSMITVSMGEVPASPGMLPKDSGLQTPSSLKVVTPSVAFSSAGAVAASEGAQVFTFPSSLPNLHPVPTSIVRSAPRGSLILCTPSKASPSGPVIYHPLTSPSSATGPLALVPVEMILPKSANKAKKQAPNTEPSPSKQQSAPSVAQNTPEDNVPEIVVDSPEEDGAVKQADKEAFSTDGSQINNEETSENGASVHGGAVSTSNSCASSVAKPSNTSPITVKAKALGSSKCFPKPLIMTPVNVDSTNVQTPTMLHLVSPSQHSPGSPLVLYPMIRPPHGQPSTKLQSPLSAGSGTPQVMILQRLAGPGGSSSLLKSALMKSMPVFQFPPPPMPGAPSSGSSTFAESDSPKTWTITSSSSPLASPLSTDGPKSSDPTGAATGTLSAAVSVICGPRLPNQKT